LDIWFKGKGMLALNLIWLDLLLLIYLILVYYIFYTIHISRYVRGRCRVS